MNPRPLPKQKACAHGVKSTSLNDATKAARGTGVWQQASPEARRIILGDCSGQVAAGAAGVLRGYVCPVHARCVPGIQINVPAIYPDALPANITPSSIPGTLSTNMIVDDHSNAQQMGLSHAPYPCKPHHGYPCQNQRIPLNRWIGWGRGSRKWYDRPCHPNSCTAPRAPRWEKRGRTEGEIGVNFARRANVPSWGEMFINLWLGSHYKTYCSTPPHPPAPHPLMTPSAAYGPPDPATDAFHRRWAHHSCDTRFLGHSWALC